MTKIVCTKEIIREDHVDSKYHLWIQMPNGNQIHFHPDEYDTYHWNGKNGLFIVRKGHRWVGCYRLDAIVGFCVCESYQDDFE